MTHRRDPPPSRTAAADPAGADDARSQRAPLRKALVVQVAATAVLLLVLAALPRAALSLWRAALLQGVIAAGLAAAWRMPRWWWLILGLFAPLAVGAQSLAWPPWLWLLGFVVLLLVFWRTDSSRVPLFMTNAIAARRIADLLPAQPCSVIDLGCGDASLLRALARARPDCRFAGYEHAPLTWAWAWLRCRALPQVRVCRANFWTQPLGGHALVYAFLSPAPMARLWDKACAEMDPGSLLVSNSFAVPGVLPSDTVQVEDPRGTVLYCYRPGGAAGVAGATPKCR